VASVVTTNSLLDKSLDGIQRRKSSSIDAPPQGFVALIAHRAG
jgi:hypothetical protein